MEKTIQLDQREIQNAQSIDQELTQAWAQVGMFSEQLDQARKGRDQAVEKQRGLIRQALVARGIERFDNARPGAQMGTIVVVVPDDVPTLVAKPNGLPQIELPESSN
jgi:hypothetical protein